MAAAGGLIIAAAQDLLVIFVGLELLSLGLYILTAFAKKSGQSAEAAMKYYLFGGMSRGVPALWLQLSLWIEWFDEFASRSAGNYWASWRGATPLLLSRAGHDRRGSRIQGRGRSIPSLGARHLRRRARSRRSIHRIRLKSCQLRAAHLHQLRNSPVSRDAAYEGPLTVTFSSPSTCPRILSRLCHRVAADLDWCFRLPRWSLATWPRSHNPASAACLPTRRSRMPATSCSAWLSSPGPMRVRRRFSTTSSPTALTTIGAFGVVGVVERATGSR